MSHVAAKQSATPAVTAPLAVTSPISEVIDHPSVSSQESQKAQARSIVASPSQSDSGLELFEFVTFDPGRKHLARVVAVNGKKVTVRRFNKKTGDWQTKNESRERVACVPLTAAEAEERFPGSVAAWERAAIPPNGSGGKVTRQMSRNLGAPLAAC
jgi:hypothetical protein